MRIALAMPKSYETSSQPVILETVRKPTVRRSTIGGQKFEYLKNDPNHPSLHLKKVGNYWSVRVGIKYRALGMEVDENVLWFWIGTHTEYDKMLK